MSCTFVLVDLDGWCVGHGGAFVPQIFKFS